VSRCRGLCPFLNEALGRASINTTTIYSHLTTNRQRQELARLLE